MKRRNYYIKLIFLTQFLFGLYKADAQFYENLRCEIYFTDTGNNKDTIVFGLSMNATDGFSTNLDVLDTAAIDDDLDVRLINYEVQNEFGGDCYNLKEDYQQLKLEGSIDDPNWIYEFPALIKRDSLNYFYYQLKVEVNVGIIKQFKTNNDLGWEVLSVDFESLDYSLTTSNAFGINGTSIYPENSANLEEFYVDAIYPSSNLLCNQSVPDAYYPVLFRINLKNNLGVNINTLDYEPINIAKEFIQINNFEFKKLNVYDSNGKLISNFNLNSNRIYFNEFQQGSNLYMLHFLNNRNQTLLTKKILKL